MLAVEEKRGPKTSLSTARVTLQALGPGVVRGSLGLLPSSQHEGRHVPALDRPRGCRRTLPEDLLPIRAPA
jgi:hypothetical protein